MFEIVGKNVKPWDKAGPGLASADKAEGERSIQIQCMGTKAQGKVERNPSSALEFLLWNSWLRIGCCLCCVESLIPGLAQWVKKIWCCCICGVVEAPPLGFNSRPRNFIGHRCSQRKKRSSPCVSVMNLTTSIHKDTRWIPGLAQWVKDQCCCESQCRLQVWLSCGYSFSIMLQVWT